MIDAGGPFRMVLPRPARPTNALQLSLALTTSNFDPVWWVEPEVRPLLLASGSPT